MSNKFIKEKALPNILVYFLKFTLPRDDERLFINCIRNAINKIYGQDRYVVYSVTDEDLKLNTRILSAKALLVIAKQEYPLDSKLQTNGSDLKKLMFIYDKLCPEKVTNFDFSYFHEKIKTLIPQENVHVDSLLMKKSDLFLFDSQFIYRKWPLLGSSLKLIDYSENANNESIVQEDNCAYLIDWNNNQHDKKVINSAINFEVDNYFDNLRTEYIGRSILFTNVITSTMSLVDHVKMIHGMVSIANYQTAGLGRNENQWLSPFGCAMFTVNIRFPFSNPLTSRISLIQHIASLSIILALPSDKLKIKIKWPNDILFMESMSKMAGILVRSFCYENYINVQIGIGINVSNQHPSICLDEIIYHYNMKQKNVQDKIKLFSREEVIAKTLNAFEMLYNKLVNNELDEIKSLYCENWIHSGTITDMHIDNGQTKKAKIIGIDDNGYLLAKDLSNGNVYFLQPDGNRFDIMNRLTAHNATKCS